MELCKYGCGKEGKFKTKAGASICDTSHTKCPALRKKNSDGNKKHNNRFPVWKHRYDFERATCVYCQKKITITQIKRHEKSCYLNPIHKKKCPVCGTFVKDIRCICCSTKCSNSYFPDRYVKLAESKRKNDEDLKGYRIICFRYHKHECIICGEDLCIAVHHYDGNNKNNAPYNLIPICPTHHTYLHSTVNLMYIVKECVDEYYESFKIKYNQDCF